MEKKIKIKSDVDFENEIAKRQGNLELLEELERYLSLKIRIIGAIRNKGLNHEISRANTIEQLNKVQKIAKRLRLEEKRNYYEFFYVTCKKQLDRELFNELEIKTKQRYERGKI